MAERFTLAPLITGSTWSNVMGALRAKPTRGLVTDDDGERAPKWTNREALAVILAARSAGKNAQGGFPLWYQFAAGAYGWTPEGDQLVKTREQADAIYDPQLAVVLQQELTRLAKELDTSKLAPRLELDERGWDAPATWAAVAQALQQDGATASFKIPLPVCRDPKTGKPARPVKRDGRWSCPGGVVTIDDPLTAITKAAAKIAVPAAVILIAYWVAKEKRGRRKRRR